VAACGGVSVSAWDHSPICSKKLLSFAQFEREVIGRSLVLRIVGIRFPCYPPQLSNFTMSFFAAWLWRAVEGFFAVICLVMGEGTIARNAAG
jgi:hypothetical protein